jgi:outer membrane lipoprotein LolB
MSSWQLNGRVSLTRGEEGWHAGLHWQVQADTFHLRISGPLGQGGFQLKGDARGVVLVDAEGQTFAARDADALLAQVTGWQLPVTGLRYWIRGLPEPVAGAAQMTRDETGRLRRLEQSGWVIKYQRYQLVEDILLPAKLQLVHADLAVRIVIDQWQLGAVATRLP